MHEVYVGIEELAHRALGVLLAGEEVLMVLLGKKGREVVVEPPCDARRGRVLEVDDGVFVAGEIAFVEERSGAVHQPVILVDRVRHHALAVESREERGAASSVEALVVVEDANSQDPEPSWGRKVKTPELYSIKALADCVKRDCLPLRSG